MLHNGIEMPVLGLGVYQAGAQTKEAVLTALQAGYRHIDTAAFYGNEKEVGEAVRESGIPREEIFITTKLWNSMQREDRQQEAIEQSLEQLDLGYIDLYFIHWPVPGKFRQTWRIIERAYEEKQIKAIGVSNFLQHHLEELSVTANIAPMVNQFECHPYCARKELRDFCKQQEIVCEAWSPLGRGALLEDTCVCQIAREHQKTPAQILLRWDIQNGIVTIPKSVHKERILENMQLFDFTLTNEQMQQLEQLDRNEMHGDPDHFDF